MQDQRTPMKRLAQANLTVEDVETWAVQGLYGLVKELAPQYGFNAGVSEADGSNWRPFRTAPT